MVKTNKSQAFFSFDYHFIDDITFLGVSKSIDLKSMVWKFIQNEMHTYEDFDDKTMGITARVLKRFDI
jgi:hypothetical protein